MSLQNALPATGRVALDFYQSYNVDLRGILAQIIIGLIVALVLYPSHINSDAHLSTATVNKKGNEKGIIFISTLITSHKFHLFLSMLYWS